MKVPIVRNILEANDRIAGQNREMFAQHHVYVINLMSSPGAGKTSLLEQTLDRVKEKIIVGVIEGDIQSSYDAERIAEKGVKAIQINTGGACHLDGNMIREAVDEFDLDELDLLVVENVGNLVCPAEFDVGEDMKVMILSVPEGDDKPFKYPLMFQECKALIINKIDLLPYVDCSIEKIRDAAYKLNPKMEVFELSCRTGEGLDEWCAWLEGKVKA
ncbi:MAG: hydrogenase nickel incorporation protein HypB [Deltaproteobacteria bacterium]|nr:hydrogenase nickel incorporation protein HypB [Deltaproteobacteria bacterium]